MALSFREQNEWIIAKYRTHKECKIMYMFAKKKNLQELFTKALYHMLQIVGDCD